MTALDGRAVVAGFVVALALTLVGFFIGFASVGLFAGTAAGSYIAARRAGHNGVAQGIGVAVMVIVGGVVAFAIAYQSTTTVSVNGTTLLWAAAVLLLGPAAGRAARR